MQTQSYAGARVRPWHQAVLTTVKRAVVSYQYWNALSLNPQQYGQAPHCYASAQHAALHATQVRRRLPTAELADLDALVEKLCALSDAELEAVLARLEERPHQWAAAIPTMSDHDLDRVLSTLTTSAIVVLAMAV